MSACPDPRTIIEHLPVALAVARATDGRLLSSNRGFAALFGAPATLGMPLTDWLRHADAGDRIGPPPDWPAHLAALHPDIRPHDSVECLLRGPAGPLHIRVQLQVADGLLIACFVDLTDHETREDILRQALAELETRSATDALTGLLTRRRFEEAAASEMQRFRRFGHPITLIMADIDHFKLINDRLGHQAGDRVLVEFARRILAECRDLDVIGRYGGEEFLVLLPSTPLVGGLTLAAKLRQAIAAAPFPDAGPLSASFGVAECQADEDWHAWLHRTDKALYRAKRQGRNLVVAAPERHDQPHAHAELSRLDRLGWEDGHTLGHPLMDHQHKELFTLAQSLLEMIRRDGPTADLHVAIRELAHTTERHFRDEEALLGEIAYPRTDQHMKAHRLLAAKLDALSSQSARGVLPAARLIEFLAYDLVDHHALGPDRDYLPWLDGRTSETP